MPNANEAKKLPSMFYIYKGFTPGIVKHSVFRALSLQKQVFHDMTPTPFQGR